MNKLMKTLFLCAAFGLAMTVVGCESWDASDWATLNDSLGNANNSFANSYSSATETGMVYTIYNRSSKTVTLYDDTGVVSIAPYGSTSARFGKSATIYNVTYSPSSVRVSQSGYSFTFTD
jgi:hypothetical protein